MGKKKLKNNTILITGANGYLGSRISEFLSKHGFNILCVERDTIYEYSKPHKKNKLDWKKTNDLVNACKNVSVVIHTAGLGANECINSPSHALEVNGLNTVRIVGAAKKTGVQLFLYISTIHVYSNTPQGNYKEQFIPTNLHPYCVSHVVGENAVVLFNSNSQKAVSLRLSNVIGAPTNKNSKAWGLFLNEISRQAIEKSQVTLLSPKKTQRDFVTISDFLNGIHFLIVNKESLNSKIINFCSSYNHTIEKIVSIFSERYEHLLGNKLNVKWKTKNNPDINLDYFKYDNSLLLSYGVEINNNIETEIDNVLTSSLKFFGTMKYETRL